MLKHFINVDDFKTKIIYIFRIIYVILLFGVYYMYNMVQTN